VKVLVINGPNLNLLGTREPDVYGRQSLEDVEARLRLRAAELECEIEFRQSNHEGEIVDWVQEAGRAFDAIVLNPGAFAHYSYAISDAITASGARVYEVHVSNVYARESFRHRSVIAPVAAGILIGMGTLGYDLALEAAVRSSR
jgi:3-dehydroquinate dehydratase-2